jgi:hypothetical protein
MPPALWLSASAGHEKRRNAGSLEVLEAWFDWHDDTRFYGKFCFF